MYPFLVWVAFSIPSQRLRVDAPTVRLYNTPVYTGGGQGEGAGQEGGGQGDCGGQCGGLGGEEGG